MNIERISFSKPAVVVLGAGATRGASFVSSRKGSLPPLDGDFFTQLQRLTKAKPVDLVTRVIENAVNIFGTNFSLTMEGYLTRLEQLANVQDDYRLVGRPGPNEYVKMRENFLQSLAAVLDEAVGRNPVCSYHKTLLESLTSMDTILSFNYDWLIDHTLKTHGRGKWNPRTAYGVPAYLRGKPGTGARYWACKDIAGKPDFSSRSVKLLKMHGAMNWFPVSAETGSLRLRLRERWWHQNGRLRFEIAPPEWNKPTRAGIYVPVWREARKALRKVRAAVFIGYSLPETDLPVQALLRVDDRALPLDLLVTVNPDQAARQRIREAVRHRMGKNTRVLSFETLAEFAGFLSREEETLPKCPFFGADPPCMREVNSGRKVGRQ